MEGGEEMVSRRRADGDPGGGEGDEGQIGGYWKRFLFGIAVMAVIFTGLLLAIDHLGLIAPAGDGAEAPPRIELFEAVPDSVRPGEGTVLRWRVSGVSLADEVRIEPGIGAVAREGRLAVQPEETTVYTLTAINAAGEDEARATVEVAGAEQPALSP